MVANNVLAHVPELHDFVEGFRILLAPGGVATFEFPHLLRLMEKNEFDTIYHEHFSYISLLVAERLMGGHGLAVFDVEELPTHGGSLRLHVRHADDASKPVTLAVGRVRAAERAAGLEGMEAYRRFAGRAVETKCALLDFLIGAQPGREEGGRLRGAGEGQHLAELLRHRAGAAALHGGSQHAQAGAPAAGHAASPSARRRRSRRRSRTSC